jgi:hypothetical protein
VRHAEHDPVRAVSGGELDGLVEQTARASRGLDENCFWPEERTLEVALEDLTSVSRSSSLRFSSAESGCR